MKKVNLFFFLIFLVTLSCKREASEQSQSILEFDVTKKYPQMTLDIHDIADVEYLVLQTRDSFLFTNFVYLTDNYVVALNYYEMSFVFFDRKGNPISSISKAGQGPEEYMPLWVQVYCEKEDEFYVFSYPDKIQVYNKVGDYKRTLRLREESSIAYIDSLFDYDEEYLLCHDKQATTSSSFYLLSKKDGKIKDIPISKSDKIATNIRKTDESGHFLTIQFDVSYAIKDGNNMILTDHSSDTVFNLTPELQLIPRFIRKPSVHEMKTPILLNGFIETEQYSFFSTEEIAYDFNTKQEGETKGYMWDKEAKGFFEVKTLNRDYKDKEIILSPVRIFSGPSERSSSPRTGVINLKAKELLAANAEGKLSGELKEVVESTPEEDLFVIMIMKF